MIVYPALSFTTIVIGHKPVAGRTKMHPTSPWMTSKRTSIKPIELQQRADHTSLIDLVGVTHDTNLDKIINLTFAMIIINKNQNKV